MAGFSIVGKPFAGIMWKADRFMATNFTLHGLIRVAYAMQDDQILGGPDWLNSERYDIDGKVEKSVADELQTLGSDQRVLQSMRILQAFLADRFRLALHRETREVSGYALVIAKSGPKLQEAKPMASPCRASEVPGKFVTIRRSWKKGDRLEMDLPMRLRLEAIDAQHPQTVALLCGPQVLFAITDVLPVVTARQLLAAKKNGQQSWQVETAGGALSMLPFTIVAGQQYSTYLIVKQTY